MRGLNAPPRKSAAPARLTSRAMVSACSRLSTAHGPAITAMFSPPMTTSPTRTQVSWGCISRPTSLKGVLTRRTRATPGRRRISSSLQPGVPRMPMRSPATGGSSRQSQRFALSFRIRSVLASGGRSFSSSTIMARFLLCRQAGCQNEKPRTIAPGLLESKPRTDLGGSIRGYVAVLCVYPTGWTLLNHQKKKKRPRIF